MITRKHRHDRAIAERRFARAGDGLLALRAQNRRSHADSIGRRLAPLKVLTVHQHWAWAIAAGYKLVENRTWRTDYRGELAILAGQSRQSLAASRELLASLGLEPPAEELLPFGAIVCLVELVDVVPVADLAGDPFATGPWCWLLANARPLSHPLSCRGLLGLADLPPAAAAKVYHEVR